MEILKYSLIMSFWASGTLLGMHHFGCAKHDPKASAKDKRKRGDILSTAEPSLARD